MINTKKILIADDDRDLVDALTLHCRTLGLHVETAHDGLTATHYIIEHEPDLVILDVNMPVRGGLTIGEMMAGEERLSKIPIIILTGRSDPEMVSRCYDMLAYYVAKCQNVWPRVEPLLHELLHLETPPDESRFDLGAAQRRHRATGVGEPPDESLVDSRSDFSKWDADRDARSRDRGMEPSFSGSWVLVIDDDPDYSFALKLRLEQHGIGLLRASAGMEGYLCAFTNRAKAIILDYEMPGGRGDCVLRRLKDNPRTSDIPVIVMTGRHNSSLARKMYSLGAVKFLTKPLDWDTLWDELRRHIDAGQRREAVC